MRRKDKNKVIAVMIVALAIMTVGYAIVNQELNLGGAASITSTFNIKFINVNSNASGEAYNIVSPSFTDATANFSTGFNSPGDVMVYELTVKNAGTLNAYLSRILVNNSDNPVILIKTSGLIEGELLAAGATKTLYVTVEYDRNVTAQPENLDANFSVTLDYTQDINNVGTSTASCFTTNTEGNAITGYNISCGKNVTIPSKINNITIDTIAEKAFSKLGIDSVVIPNTITTLERKAFYENNLTEAIVPNSVTTIGGHAFGKNKISTLIIPNSVTFIDYSAFTNNQMPAGQEFVYNRNSDGSLNMTSLNSYAGANRQNIIIPESVTEIGRSAFNDCDIEAVSMPSNLKTINEDAFTYNKLKQINLPSTVTSIGLRAFNANNVPSDATPFIYKRNTDGSIDETEIISYAGVEYSNIVVPEGVTTVGEDAFYDTGISGIILPNSLQTIEARAFRYCWFTTITIPANVTEIGKGAIEKSTSSNEPLVKIINTTGNGFDWPRIVNSETSGNLTVTGTVTNTFGDVEITSE